jgi:murein tripeptide amidase MpaA
MGGIFMDWVYEHQGVLCWSTELWNVAKQAGIEKTDMKSQLKKTPNEIEADGVKLLQWNDQELNGEGFVAWTPFVHPNLGPVEIGGWKTKYVRQNPPEKFLEAECHNNAMFTLVHAHSLPQLDIRKVKVEAVSPGFYRVSAGVVNQGYLPTNGSDQAARLSVTKPVEATIAGEGVAISAGKEKLELGQLAGWGEKKVEWLVQAKAGTKATITAHGERAGKAQIEVTLN